MGKDISCSPAEHQIPILARAAVTPHQGLDWLLGGWNVLARGRKRGSQREEEREALLPIPPLPLDPLTDPPKTRRLPIRHAPGHSNDSGTAVPSNRVRGIVGYSVFLSEALRSICSS